MQRSARRVLEQMKEEGFACDLRARSGHPGEVGAGEASRRPTRARSSPVSSSRVLEGNRGGDTAAGGGTTFTEKR